MTTFEWYVQFIGGFVLILCALAGIEQEAERRLPRFKAWMDERFGDEPTHDRGF